MAQDAANVARKLIRDHLVSGEMTPGAEIGIRIDHTLTQDATGTMVMLELEAMGVDPAKGVLRLSFTHYTTRAEIDQALSALDAVL